MHAHTWYRKGDYQDYQDPSRLPTVGHPGWPSTGKKSKCLKIPHHVPQVMIKLPLECIHWPNPHHIIIQPIPLLAHLIRKLASFLEQLEDMPSPTIISHNLKELLRIHILKAFKNLKRLQSDPLSKTWSPRYQLWYRIGPKLTWQRGQCWHEYRILG